MVKRGVPQGSVLDPLLFLLYVNDLPKNIEYNMVQFADGTSIIYKDIVSKDNDEKISTLLKKLEDWFQSNSLCLNIEKTIALPFNKKYKEVGG